MAVSAILVALGKVGKVVTSPYTTAALLGANTIMNGVEIKQGEDIKSSVSRIETEVKSNTKLLETIAVNQEVACTSADLEAFETSFFEKLSEPVEISALPASADGIPVMAIQQMPTPTVQQPVQTASQPTPPAQAPVQTVTVNPGTEALTKDEFNAALTNFANGLGNMLNGFVGELKDVMNPATPATSTTTAPETPPTAPKGDASKTGK